MSRKNRASLTDRVVKAADASLAAQHYVSLIDALVGIGWLDPGAARRWRHGQIDCLEEALQTNPSRISEAMKLFGSWASSKGLLASETDLVMWRARQREEGCASVGAGIRRSNNFTEP